MSADEMSVWTGRLREAEGPAQCGRAASSPDGRTGEGGSFRQTGVLTSPLTPGSHATPAAALS